MKYSILFLAFTWATFTHAQKFSNGDLKAYLKCSIALSHITRPPHFLFPAGSAPREVLISGPNKKFILASEEGLKEFDASKVIGKTVRIPGKHGTYSLEVASDTAYFLGDPKSNGPKLEAKDILLSDDHPRLQELKELYVADILRKLRHVEDFFKAEQKDMAINGPFDELKLQEETKKRCKMFQEQLPACQAQSLDREIQQVASEQFGLIIGQCKSREQRDLENRPSNKSGASRM